MRLLIELYKNGLVLFGIAGLFIGLIARYSPLFHEDRASKSLSFRIQYRIAFGARILQIWWLIFATYIIVLSLSDDPVDMLLMAFVIPGTILHIARCLHDLQFGSRNWVIRESLAAIVWIHDTFAGGDLVGHLIGLILLVMPVFGVVSMAWLVSSR